MRSAEAFADSVCRFRRLLAVVLITAICGTWGSAQNGSHNKELESQKHAVALVEKNWLNALNTANVDATADILADDFMRPASDSGRFITRADLLAFYRSHLSSDSSNKRRIEDLTVTIYGSTALARGAVITTNSEGNVISKLLFTDVFVHHTGKWQAVSAQESSVNVRQPSQ